MAMAASPSPLSSPSPSASAGAAGDPTDDLSGGGGGAARSPSPLPLPAPPSSSSSRRLPPPCWSNDETLALIDAYREKWYALRRGNLRASHWDEVAASVAARCRASPLKTAVQCRHKIEKLRKRYRSEKLRSPHPSWIFFKKLDSMDFGLTASSHPPQPPTRPPSSRSAPPATRPAPTPPSSDDDDDDIPRRPPVTVNGGISGLRFKIPKAVRSKSKNEKVRPVPIPIPIPNPSPSPRSNPGGSNNRYFRGFGGTGEEMRRRLEERRKVKRRREREGDVVGEMVGALRMLGDGYMRMEQMKMDMAREMEKVRMEMELKRTEMILDCQRRLVDSFVKGLGGGGGGGKRRASPED